MDIFSNFFGNKIIKLRRTDNENDFNKSRFSPLAQLDIDTFFKKDLPCALKTQGKFQMPTDKEFEQLKEKIQTKLDENPDLAKYFKWVSLRKENILVADRILSNECLYNNSDFMKYAHSIISDCTSPERAQAKCTIIDKILSDKNLYGNLTFMKYTGKIIEDVYTPEQAQEKIDLIDEILQDETNANNPDLISCVGIVIRDCSSIVRAQETINFINKYLNDKELNLAPNQITMLLEQKRRIKATPKELAHLNKTVGKENAAKLSKVSTELAIKYLPLYNKKDLNEIPLAQRRGLLRNLVASNADLFYAGDELKELFPLLPSNQEEYCSLLPSIVRSIGIETNTLSGEEVENFNVSLASLGDTLANITDEEFNNLDITQEYSKDEFIADTLEKVKDLTPSERQKVYDYFGFELHPNSQTQTGFSLTGYPANLNNGEKLAQITEPETKEVVENLRENVIRFSENNHITCNNKDVEQYLNEIVQALPELRTMIGRKQHGTHDFDVMQHSLKVMKKIVENPEFKTLDESDKKIMLLASLLHDITKKEGYPDKTHAEMAGFDSFFIAKKFNLTQDEEIKLNTLIKKHEWLNSVNSSNNQKEQTKNIQSTAYDLRHDNLFDMALIFTHADLKAVKKDDSFHDATGYGKKADYYGERIKECINELKKSQPIIPITKLPPASEIASRITHVNDDGSTNIKGVYRDETGLIIIKYNEVENWEELGLPKGCTSRGAAGTGNIKFIAHGLDYKDQLANFDAFSLVDSDALLSVSYMECPEIKYRLFRPQGVLLEVATKHIHGGGKTDTHSGFKKNIQSFKDDYILGGSGKKQRLFISDLIKHATGMNDEEYIEFVKKNENKSLNEIEPEELRETLIKAFASINSKTRYGKSSYNEMYISNPKSVNGVFAYNQNPNGEIGNPVEFLHSKEVNGRTDFLQDYAKEHDIPFVVFGD